MCPHGFSWRTGGLFLALGALPSLPLPPPRSPQCPRCSIRGPGRQLKAQAGAAKHLPGSRRHPSRRPAPSALSAQPRPASGGTTATAMPDSGRPWPRYRVRFIYRLQAGGLSFSLSTTARLAVCQCGQWRAIPCPGSAARPATPNGGGVCQPPVQPIHSNLGSNVRRACMLRLSILDVRTGSARREVVGGRPG